MGIRIEFDTGTTTTDELDALVAFLSDLGYKRDGIGELPPIEEPTVAADSETPQEPYGLGQFPYVNDLSLTDRESALLAGDPGTPPPVSVGFGGDTPSGLDFPVPPDRDSRNLPHDERIHSASRALNADGTWRKRRGVDDATVERVEAELLGVSVEEPVTDAERAAVEAPFGAVGEVVSEAQSILEYGMGFHSGAPAPGLAAVIAPPPPQAPSEPVVPPPPAAAVLVPPTPITVPTAFGPVSGTVVAVGSVPTFPSLISRVTAAVTAGSVTMLQVSAICQELGVEALPLVGGRPDLFQPLSERLSALGV